MGLGIGQGFAAVEAVAGTGATNGLARLTATFRKAAMSDHSAAASAASHFWAGLRELPFGSSAASAANSIIEIVQSSAARIFATCSAYSRPGASLSGQIRTRRPPASPNRFSPPLWRRRWTSWR